MRFIAGLLALTLAAGCGSDATTQPASVEGKWTLLTVNAAPLPLTLGTLPDGARLELLSQTITLSGGKYTAATSFRSTSTSGQATTSDDSDTGTYTQSGSALTFTSAFDNSVSTATMSGNRFTTGDPSFVLIFGRS